MIMNQPRSKLPAPRRLSIELTDDVYNELDKIFDFGERKIFFTAVCEAVINTHRKYGKEALYLMISGRLDLLKVLANNKSEQAEQ